MTETKRRGEIVARAIDAYHARIGEFPFELKDLQPEFLKDIPEPAAGDKKWHYMVVSDGREWVLEVVASEWGPGLERTSNGHWYYYPGEK